MRYTNCPLKRSSSPHIFSMKYNNNTGFEWGFVRTMFVGAVCISASHAAKKVSLVFPTHLDLSRHIMRDRAQGILQVCPAIGSA